jgi:hypothetical protein
MSWRLITYIIFFLYITFLSSFSFGQKVKIKGNIGYGIWESFHLGIDLRVKNYSGGIDAGTSFGTFQFDHEYYSFTLDNAFYFGKANRYGIKSWYVDARFIYWNHTEPGTTWNVFQLCPSIGKEFNFSKSIGINLDLGPAILLNASRHDNTKEKVGWIYPVYPEVRFEFFYRF